MTEMLAMFGGRITSVISHWHEREDGQFPDIDASVVYESRAFHKRVVLFWTTFFERRRVLYLDDDQSTLFYCYATQAAIRIIKMGHAVVPGVKVTPVKSGKPEYLLEYRMERIPVHYLIAWEGDDFYVHPIKLQKDPDARKTISKSIGRIGTR